MFGILTRILRIKKKIDTYYSKEYDIIKEPNTAFPIVYNIKDATWEDEYLSKTYGINLEGNIRFFHPEQNILRVKNASIYSHSDIVLSDKGVLWDKACLANFSKVVPLDSNLLSYNNNSIKFRRYKNRKEVPGNCISLLGVHDGIWAHFIVQFLEKLYYANDAKLLDDNITIICPKYTDSHINQIVKDYISKFPCVKLLVAEGKTEYVCETLLYMPSATIISNHAEYTALSDMIIPSLVTDKLQNELVRYYTKQVESDNNEYKLYLVRRGNYRAMTNWQEAEDYFRDKGFILVEPHKLSLIEKVKLFSKASIIVGPYSSAFSNIIFSQKGTRLLFFSNQIRTNEFYYPTFAHNFGLKIMFVTGQDCGKNIHANFEIPLSRIEAAYNELING